MTSSFEDFTKKAEAFLEEHITEYLSVDMALKILQDNTTKGFLMRSLPLIQSRRELGNSLKRLIIITRKILREVRNF